MNDPIRIGPCADYEHDLVELNDGALPPGRTRVVQLHLAECARCRAWAADFAALDARLAAGLPQPVLSAQFDSRLRERIASLTRPATRSDLRAQAEHEHDSLVAALERAARRRAVLGAAASVTATLCVLAAVRDALVQHAAQLETVTGGAWLVPGAIGVLVAVGALAWSTRADTLPMLGFGR
jgi:anti-sigma factor RsiW